MLQAKNAIRFSLTISASCPLFHTLFYPVVGLLLYLLACTSCSDITHSQQIIADADSLAQLKILYDDTCALQEVVSVLKKPYLHPSSCIPLAKAYYYLGKNKQQAGELQSAVSYYLAAEKLYPKDDFLCGNLCFAMGRICAQQREDSAALVFLSRAEDYYLYCRHHLQYAHTLLSRSEVYACLGNFACADSLWQICHTTRQDDIDFDVRLLETRGLYFYYRQEYDSALLYLRSIPALSIPNETKCWVCQKIMQTYYRMGQKDSAVCYAQYIATQSDNPTYCSNAYFVLEEYAHQIGNIDLLAQYAHLREDASRRRETLSGNSAAATAQLLQYLSTPYPNMPWKKTTILISILCAVVLLVCMHLYRVGNRAKGKLSATQSNSKKQKATIHTILKDQNENDLKHLIANFRTLHPLPPKSWNDYATFRHDISGLLPHLIERLAAYHLSEQEIRLCAYIVIYDNIPLTDLAAYLYYSRNSMGNTKLRIAKKIGTTSANLYVYLLQLELCNQQEQPLVDV